MHSTTLTRGSAGSRALSGAASRRAVGRAALPCRVPLRPVAAATAVLERPTITIAADVLLETPLSPSLFSTLRDQSGPQPLLELPGHKEPRPTPHDFVTLVELPAAIVQAKFEDAVTHQMLTGKAHGVLRSQSDDDTSVPPRFNLKQLKSVRDHVTRNLAPAVAHACAGAVAEAKRAKKQRVTALLAEQRAAAQRLGSIY
ncbi:hypothetical protein HYH03_014320 [Edaphochlamys debaryana]|uniref:Uncharacterized protein n=1 Tax=Edaphochlamys debaryana TaxID=47281 RepID=A0A836BTQ1_9CHLO|nr:hypothetical protein HYH03_014320 [Edaphochlamys debaryana]|eukprot:KAG2487074.1 hypothetical protein HYH03_014320 [Edaphochlamys debaryana]